MKRLTNIVGTVALLLLCWQRFGGELPDIVTPTPPAPIAVTTPHALVIAESEIDPQQPFAQRQAVQASALLFKQLGIEGRCFDPDTNLANEDEWVRTLMQRPRAGLPWIAIVNGSRWTEQPFPPTYAEAKALLESFR